MFLSFLSSIVRRHTGLGIFIYDEIAPPFGACFSSSSCTCVWQDGFHHVISDLCRRRIIPTFLRMNFLGPKLSLPFPWLSWPSSGVFCHWSSMLLAPRSAQAVPPVYFRLGFPFLFSGFQFPDSFECLRLKNSLTSISFIFVAGRQGRTHTSIYALTIFLGIFESLFLALLDFFSFTLRFQFLSCNSYADSKGRKTNIEGKGRKVTTDLGGHFWMIWT